MLNSMSRLCWEVQNPASLGKCFLVCWSCTGWKATHLWKTGWKRKIIYCQVASVILSYLPGLFSSGWDSGVLEVCVCLFLCACLVGWVCFVVVGFVLVWFFFLCFLLLFFLANIRVLIVTFLYYIVLKWRMKECDFYPKTLNVKYLISQQMDTHWVGR